jgi:hypothetical protein
MPFMRSKLMIKKSDFKAPEYPGLLSFVRVVCAANTVWLSIGGHSTHDILGWCFCQWLARIVSATRDQTDC